MKLSNLLLMLIAPLVLACSEPSEDRIVVLALGDWNTMSPDSWVDYAQEWGPEYDFRPWGYFPDADNHPDVNDVASMLWGQHTGALANNPDVDICLVFAGAWDSEDQPKLAGHGQSPHRNERWFSFPFWKAGDVINGVWSIEWQCAEYGARVVLVTPPPRKDCRSGRSAATAQAIRDASELHTTGLIDLHDEFLADPDWPMLMQSTVHTYLPFTCHSQSGLCNPGNRNGIDYSRDACVADLDPRKLNDEGMRVAADIILEGL